MTFTSCPKCGTERPEGMTECYLCGYLFDLAEVASADGGVAVIEPSPIDDPKCIVCGAEIAPYAYVCVACGATVTPWDGYERSDYGEEEDDDLSEQERADILATFTVYDYLDFLGKTYSWRTIYMMWKETKGFITGIENALSKYRPRYGGSINFRVVKILIRALRAHPDQDALDEQIENWYLDELLEIESRYDERDIDITELEDIPIMEGYLELQAMEQQQINLKNAHDYERYEAERQY